MNGKTKYYKFINIPMLIYEFNAVPNMILTEFSDHSDELIYDSKTKRQTHRDKKFLEKKKNKTFYIKT